MSANGAKLKVILTKPIAKDSSLTWLNRFLEKGIRKKIEKDEKAIDWRKMK
jgi:predicted HAD superfamily phosphohydrolase YqeG